MPLCPDCEDPLLRVDEYVYYCQKTELYYPMSTRGKLGYPQLEPPTILVKQKETFKKIDATKPAAAIDITSTNMTKHPQFFKFCQQFPQYAGAHPIKIIQEIRNSDGTTKDSSTKRIVLVDFVKWLQT
jgi:hypothetical protein